MGKCLDGADQDSGASGLDGGGGRGGRVRAAVADQESVATRGRTLLSELVEEVGLMPVT
jgi:hypothetical protein